MKRKKYEKIYPINLTCDSQEYDLFVYAKQKINSTFVYMKQNYKSFHRSLLKVLLHLQY